MMIKAAQEKAETAKKNVEEKTAEKEKAAEKLGNAVVEKILQNKMPKLQQQH